MSEIRYDRLNDQYVIMAPERLFRPNLECNDPKQISTITVCPFCEGNEDLTPSEIFAIRDNGVNDSSWKTRVIPNLYKALQVELSGRSKRDGLFESMPGIGAHEILIDTPKHDGAFYSMSASEIENWLRTLIIRMEDLKNDQRLIYLSIFKNYGRDAGATQEHPHTQLLALPIMPTNEIRFLEKNMSYYKKHGRGLVEDIVYNEMILKERVIAQQGEFIAFCPYASSFPFEVMIAPLYNIAKLCKCSREELVSLSLLIKRVFERLNKQLGDFAYNLSFHMAPINKNFENESYMDYMEQNYRFILHITPRIYKFAGFEVATSMAINSVLPEECAKMLAGE
jgi:UDPglucose--hexose-1-phosphate uridylyltransferase